MSDNVTHFVSPPPDTKNKSRRAKVAFSYAAENVDELNLQPGEVRRLACSLKTWQQCTCIIILSMCSSVVYHFGCVIFHDAMALHKHLDTVETGC